MITPLRSSSMRTSSASVHSTPALSGLSRVPCTTQRCKERKKTGRQLSVTVRHNQLHGTVVVEHHPFMPVNGRPVGTQHFPGLRAGYSSPLQHAGHDGSTDFPADNVQFLLDQVIGSVRIRRSPFIIQLQITSGPPVVQPHTRPPLLDPRVAAW